MRRTAITLAAAATLLLVTGCGASAEVTQRSDGVSLIVASGSGDGMDSRLTGVLAVVEGDCVGVDAGGTQLLVAWPPGTEITPDGDLVLTLDDQDYALGDEVALTGGAVQAAESSAVPKLPESCTAEEIFLVNG